jgi:GxxExxY protein
MVELGNKELSGKVIDAAIAVHRELGPGFLESVYEEALALELTRRGIAFERQKPISILYAGEVVGEHRLDLLVKRVLVVELKAIRTLEDIHFSIGRSYLRACNLTDGIILNFATMPLTIKRIGADHPTP